MKVKDLIFHLQSLLDSGQADLKTKIVFYTPFNRPIRKISVVTKKQTITQRMNKLPPEKLVVLD